MSQRVVTDGMGNVGTAHVRGGPMDGKVVDWTADVVELAEAPEMAYHRTRPTNEYLGDRDTDHDWRLKYDPDWWIKNLPEPDPPQHVYEWHEWGWQSPEVAMIRGMVREATERVFGSQP